MKQSIQIIKLPLWKFPLCIVLLMVCGCSIFDSGYTPQSYGTLIITTVPENTDIYLDKVFIGNTPIKPLRIKASKHLIRVEKEGYEPWQKKIKILSLNEHSVLVELRKTPSTQEPE